MSLKTILNPITTYLFTHHSTHPSICINSFFIPQFLLISIPIDLFVTSTDLSISSTGLSTTSGDLSIICDDLLTISIT